MKNSSGRVSSAASYRTIREELSGVGNDLTNFYFSHGSNIYVFSYLREGVRRHTLIDAGDSLYENQILSIMFENGVDPSAIDRIIITHRHPDHCGLAYILAKQSGAKILVHANFKSFVEGQSSEFPRQWMGKFVPSKLSECNMEYLPGGERDKSIDIGGLNFPSMVEPIEIGDSGKLLILACPKSAKTHTVDQVIALYSPEFKIHAGEKSHNGYRPTDDMLFSGDLWLMKGPIFDRRWIGSFLSLRRFINAMKNLRAGKNIRGEAVTEQDAQAKEALKGNFSLIRVKPGHGDEFIGSRIIPRGLPAERDVLKDLGYPMNVKRSILKSKETASKVVNIDEKAYLSFIHEITSWQEQGYNVDEISDLLVRIYTEQKGGSPLTALDRKQRRVKMKKTLSRFKSEKTDLVMLRQLAECTLPKLDRIK